MPYLTPSISVMAPIQSGVEQRIIRLGLADSLDEGAKIRLPVGAICKGLSGVNPLVRTIEQFGGSTPQKLLVLALLFKVYGPCFQTVLYGHG